MLKSYCTQNLDESDILRKPKKYNFQISLFSNCVGFARINSLYS